MRIWINSTLKTIKATIVAFRILRKAIIVAFSTKFLGLQTLGSFKGFKWMGRVQNYKLFYQTFSEGERRSFFRNFMIRIIIKCSKNISCVLSFLFHTNVVKHEKQLDAQFLTENKIKKWFSSLFISIGYIRLCILSSIYLSKALSSIATHGVTPVLS